MCIFKRIYSKSLIRWGFFFFLGLLLSVVTYSIYVKYKPYGPHIFQSGCVIINEKAEVIKLLPGYHCILLDNGDFIASSPGYKMSYYKSDGEPVWTDDNPSSHKLDLTNDKKHFLAITSERKFFNKKNARGDVFSVRTLDNKILKSWSVFKNMDALKKLKLKYFENEDLVWPADWLDPKLGFQGEVSHANSFHEISKNSEIPGSTIWRAGNYLVYIFGPIATALVLDSDMKNILWHYDFKNSYMNKLHDLQVIAGGHLMAFVNDADPSFQKHYSAVMILDPNTMRPIWSYADMVFYSANQGGVQILPNGNFLISVSDFDNFGFYEVDYNKNKIYSFIGSKKKYNYGPEVKQIDLQKFLTNNRL